MGWLGLTCPAASSGQASGDMLYVKGAPESILERCSSPLDGKEGPAFNGRGLDSGARCMLGCRGLLVRELSCNHFTRLHNNVVV